MKKNYNKILIIGSGPIVIGQAAEFDYAGTQACMALREEGYSVVLCNSNPATIMTDSIVADKIYMEPITIEYLTKIIETEKPDAILPNLGGQTGLNMAMQLYDEGILNKYNVKLLGTSIESIKKAEDRELFKELCEDIGEPTIPSIITYNIDEAKKAALEIGYPVVLRPAFTLGGTGGGFANNEDELINIAAVGFSLSPVNQILVEKSVRGYKEIEFEVMRDSADNVITICGMENVDPVGVHTGDSIVVAPILSLSKSDEKMLNDSAIKLIKSLKIEGGCNVQFALNPNSSEYYLIEVNPRVSRSSALASKASGYPIAKVTSKIAVGLTLDEIYINDCKASTQPQLNYIITKMPRFPFDKFVEASNVLGTQMKSTGEVMGIGSNFEESFMKALISIDKNTENDYLHKFSIFTDLELKQYINIFHSDNIFAIIELLRRRTSISEISNITKINKIFIEGINNIVKAERELSSHKFSAEILAYAKKIGFSDSLIAKLWQTTDQAVYNFRHANNIRPVFRMINTLNSKKEINYYFSSYTGYNESILDLNTNKIIVLGAGPIRIGQGIEFDYSTVHAVQALKNNNYYSIIINNNPETVSTDYTISNKLYFEPLTTEHVLEIYEFENPIGVIATLGGQTAINLADPLSNRGCKLLGTSKEAIDNAENRDTFEKILSNLSISKPDGSAVLTEAQGIDVANTIGYPVLVRPSFVLGGSSMQVVYNDNELRYYLNSASNVSNNAPVLIDKYIEGKEVEVDAICDGETVFIPAIMELVERTGVHSGDSISVYPPKSLSKKVKEKIIDYTERLGLAIGIHGLFNIQYIVKDDDIFVIEVNPRSSRTVPFISKATGCQLADIAANVMIGKSLKSQNITVKYLEENKEKCFVKLPVFSLNKINGADGYLSPEMKSTGEVIGISNTFEESLYKAFTAANYSVKTSGKIYITLADKDKNEALPLIKTLRELGFVFESTVGTMEFLHSNNIESNIVGKTIEEMQTQYKELVNKDISFVINTSNHIARNNHDNSYYFRCVANNNNIPVFTSLDTLQAYINVLKYFKKQGNSINL